MMPACRSGAGRHATGEDDMRIDLGTVVVTVLVVAGAALAGAPGTAAEPANGTALVRSAAASTPLSQISYVRRHGWVCYRKCYREYFIGHRVCRTFC
jgi:hypothetical protein